MAVIAQDKLNSIDIRLSLIEETVTKLAKWIEGNGKLGLLDRAQKLENRLDNHLEVYEDEIENKKNAEKERHDFWQKVTLLVIGMILSNIGVMIFAIFK